MTFFEAKTKLVPRSKGASSQILAGHLPELKVRDVWEMLTITSSVKWRSYEQACNFEKLDLKECAKFFISDTSS